MEIRGKVHCFFEQSGTFKNEFRKMGIDAEDYDIQDEFKQTDHVVDLFEEIDNAYDNRPSLFDRIGGSDLIMAFFPCIHFCDAKVMAFKGTLLNMRTWSMEKIMRHNVEEANVRNNFYTKLLKLVAIVAERGLRMIIENPWNPSNMTYLQLNFINPTIVDKNRALRGDYYVKPTAYWFIGCKNTEGCTIQRNPNPKVVYNVRGKKQVTGQCDEERSLISPDYARNFICDFILGKGQPEIDPQLF